MPRLYIEAPLGRSAGEALPPATEAVTDRPGVGVSRIDRETIDRLRPERVEELAFMAPGVHPGNMHGGLETALRVRGFDLSRPRWNGQPDIHRLFVRDLYTVERVELLSGPDAVTEGVTSPGGALRYTGKRPHYTPHHEIGVEVGEPAHRRLLFDSTDALPGSERLAYRFTLAAQDGETDPGDRSARRYHALAGLAWHYHRDGELRLEHERQRNQQPFNMGTVITPDGPVYDVVYQGAEQESVRDYRRLAAYWAHRLSPTLQLSAQWARARVERDETLIGFFTGGQLPVTDDLGGYYAELDDDYRQEDARLGLDYERPLWGVEQQLAVGLDYHRSEIDFRRWQSFRAYTVALDRPRLDEVDVEELTLFGQYRPEESERTGAYWAQRWGESERWQIGYGVRYTRYEVRAAAGTPDEPLELQRMVDDDHITWHIGALIGSTQAHFFANTGTGMELTGRYDVDGEALPPIRSQVYEAGYQVRLDSAAAEQRVRLTLFRTEQEDIQGPAGGDPLAFTITGDRRTSGVEVLYSLDFGNWQGELTLAEQRGYDQRLQADGVAQRVGSTDLPERQIGGMVSYNLQRYLAQPLQLWWASEYVDQRLVGHDGEGGEVWVESYWRHDIGASYRWPQQGPRLDLRVRNVTDLSYLAGMRVQGDRRSAKLALTHAF
nr:TonB-dependent receptor [Halorhodospira abdelmalekii]